MKKQLISSKISLENSKFHKKNPKINSRFHQKIIKNENFRQKICVKTTDFVK